MEEWLDELREGHFDTAWDLFITRYRRVIFAAIRHYTRDHDDVMDVFARVCESLREDDMRRVRSYTEGTDRRARFTTWLVAVVRNLTVDWFRHRDGRRRMGLDDLGLSPLGRRIAEHVYFGGSGHVEAFELICSRDPPGPSFREFLTELRATHQLLSAGRFGRVLRELARPLPDEVASVAEARDQRDQLASVLRTISPEERVLVQLYVMDELPAADVARITGLANAKAVYNAVYRILPVLRARLAEAGIHSGDL